MEKSIIGNGRRLDAKGSNPTICDFRDYLILFVVYSYAITAISVLIELIGAPN